MNLYDLIPLGAIPPGNAHADRPVTVRLHDSPDARLVLFHFEPGQEVPVHTSTSTVTLTVVEGSLTLVSASGEHPAERGAVAVYEPREPHGMRATSGRALLLATITPRPGERHATTPTAV